MNESVSATPPTKLDIITDNIYTTDGTPQHMRSVTTNTNNTTIINTPRTPTDVRLYHPSMIRTASIDNSNNASKSMTIVVQNPFEDSIRHIDDPSNDPSGATKYLLHSPSPSKQHNIGNVQSPRTISRTPTPGTPHQTPDDVSMTSPSMSTNLQRHPSQQTRPPLSTQTSNNGTLTNISMARNIVPQQQTQSSQHHVRFNQDLLNNYGINVPMTRQTSQPGTNETSSTSSPSNSPSVTSLIPLPSPLPNNLGVNMHHMNQASITPTILGGFPIHQSSSQSTGTNNNFISPQQTNVQNKSDNHHNISSHGSHHPLSTSTHHTPTGIYVNTRQMLSSPVTTITGIGKVKQQLPPPPPPQQQLQPQPIRPGMPTNGTPTGPSTVVLRYPPMIQTPQQTQQHAYQMMKPRMIPPNAFGSRGAPPPQPPPPPPQLIMQPITMQQSAQIIYDPNTLYRTPGQQQQPPPPPPQVQQQINSLQTNPHMNDSLINQQKHQHQQSIPQQVLHLPSGMLTTDDNILKSLLQINPQANSEEIAAIKARTNNNTMSNGISTDSNDPYDNSQMNIHDNSTHNYSNSHHHLYNPSLNTQTHSNNSTGTTVPNIKIPKSRKKRKPNDLNTSFEDDVPTKPRKRKKKGTEETEKFVEHSLQQLRDLPMLTPLEPSIDINNDLSLSLPFDLPDKKYQYQGEFGNVFIENISDHYRPYRKPPVKPISSIISSNSLSMLERRYRLCSTLLDHPPNLPSPPLTVDSNDKLSELLIKEQNNDIRDDESIISTSTLADDDHIINNMETENIQLLKTLSSNNDLRSLSPVLISNDILTTKNSELLLAPSATTTTATSTVDIKKEINDTPVTSAPPGGNELEKKDRPIVEGTDKVSVTLTLTTEAANNVQSVIAAVADLLKIAYPSTFDVHQTINNNSNVHYSSSFDQNCSCSTTLNNNNSNNFLSSSTIPQISTISRSLSTYKIGRETSVSIQSLIEMQPKYCRNCTQRLATDTIFKKRLTELPSAIRELIPNSEPFVYFCNEQCFNNCVSTTHNQQQTLTINTSINNSPIIKNESMDTTSPPCTPNDLNGSPNGRSRRLSLKRRQDSLNKSNGDKRWKDIRWKRWDPSITLKTVIRPSNTQEIEQLISDMKIPLSQNAKQDKRICAFCNGIGDMTTNGPGRLLNLDVGQWCHLNCALWSTEVYETVSGALMCVEQAYKRSINTECASCKQKGASLTCFFQRCPNTYHFPCAVNNGCVFYKNKTIMCPVHASRTTAIDQILEDKSVFRKVWINRDEVKQIQSYMTEEHEETSYTLRIGSLILHNIGQLLPHQLQSAVFHNRNFIYPVGYNVTRFYWSMRRPNRRCAYNCSIIDINNKPMFRIRIQENEDEPAQEFLESTAKLVWHKIVDEIDSLRRQHGLVKMFSVFVSGEDLYGLTEPHIIRLIESLPGVEMLQNYAFKYGRLQLLDMPLTLNPTGCARSEPKLQTHFRRHAQTLTSSHSTRSALPRTVLGVEGTQIPYVKHFVLSKSTQYRKLKTEWRQNVFLAKSRIQGLGLFAGRDLEKHTMVIEYIGELIRNEVANKREKLYEQQNRGIYMFRLDEEYVVDATMSGCLARYINHSCEPNSIAEVVQIEKDSKIIIITNRRIAKGEEIMYDYKFDFEEDSKIPCLCGAANCRKWMN
ncbi:unnamed protein product [Rotaria sordida]|uniref:Histone-lysine N-methyltransferase n=1 Tax=Rotaria sordida TaxID=392033 RepID=A0A814X321_9BILA|nr:unnamed protein product [Rotaria sordida]CAF3652651.1 unnamed protein product [Rotaria sordida]